MYPFCSLYHYILYHVFSYLTTETHKFPLDKLLFLWYNTCMMTEQQRITNRIQAFGGQAFLVGGSVRDMLLGKESKDVDIEVFGIDAQTLIQALQPFGKIDTVGASFGVIKLTTRQNDFDFSLPRRESKSGKGHKGFIVEPDETMTLEESSKRRDFTWNALSIDLSTGRLFDFFGGQEDLENRILRATSEHFSEDALRVLRGFQFAGRFEMTVEPRTTAMCGLLIDEFEHLSIERVWMEWEKWACKSVKPSMGLDFLLDTGWVSLFSELDFMVGLQQDSAWHPEGDVWEHTLQSVDVAVEIAEREQLDMEQRTVLVFAALCHDMGKAETTELCEDGHIRSRSHDTVGAELAESFLLSIGSPAWLIEKVVPLVREHMFHVHTRKPTARSIRRLSIRLEKATVQELAWVMEIDHSARQPLPKGKPQHVELMISLAEQEQCFESQVQPILMGRHLIELGLIPGPEFGVILRKAMELQLDGTFSDLESAREWARGYTLPLA